MATATRNSDSDPDRESFPEELHQGRFRWDPIRDLPERSRQDAGAGDAFIEEMTDLLHERVDPDAVDLDKSLPEGFLEETAGNARTPRPDRPEAAVPPAAGPERRLPALWSKALDVDGTGTHDNFVDLGGTSAALVRLRGALNADPGRELPVAWLVEHPTAEARVRSLTAGDGRTDAPAATTPQRSAPERRRELSGRRRRA
ncbi:phosphopantetheine-binding protein [Streptomyces sp. NPDC012751]|uniref:phosphopantetheine-binding protein n=1 Tax=Streptomyces sp. NPDC012751 TaxID=3364846 RepID=UPI0036910095